MPAGPGRRRPRHEQVGFFLGDNGGATAQAGGANSQALQRAVRANSPWRPGLDAWMRALVIFHLGKSWRWIGLGILGGEGGGFWAAPFLSSLQEGTTERGAPLLCSYLLLLVHIRPKAGTTRMASPPQPWPRSGGVLASDSGSGVSTALHGLASFSLWFVCSRFEFDRPALVGSSPRSSVRGGLRKSTRKWGRLRDDCAPSPRRYDVYVRSCPSRPGRGFPQKTKKNDKNPRGAACSGQRERAEREGRGGKERPTTRTRREGTGFGIRPSGNAQAGEHALPVSEGADEQAALLQPVRWMGQMAAGASRGSGADPRAGNEAADRLGKTVASVTMTRT